jgi:hypothetical protein
MKWINQSIPLPPMSRVKLSRCQPLLETQSISHGELMSLDCEAGATIVAADVIASYLIHCFEIYTIRKYVLVNELDLTDHFVS